ncbi:hypothetical protein CIB84_015938 [Bambusicola thoracicus]|uniref:Uncharacterized protein n=1 Tax=Bambusicola thoracicus TaxID=9083 RepID=A0A2P4S884_BAMTH|nr:hypothetical protein CIB84_015938 [Bambusicola thoracicus]
MAIGWRESCGRRSRDFKQL